MLRCTPPVASCLIEALNDDDGDENAVPSSSFLFSLLSFSLSLYGVGTIISSSDVFTGDAPVRHSPSLDSPPLSPYSKGNPPLPSLPTTNRKGNVANRLRVALPHTPNGAPEKLNGSNLIMSYSMMFDWNSELYIIRS